MRNRLLYLAAGMLLTATAGCAGDPFEVTAADTVAAIKEYADVLSTVKDRASAEAARSQLEAAVEKMQSVHKRRQALGTPTPEQDAAVKQKYGTELDAQSKRMSAQMRRLSMDKETAEALEDIWKKVQKARAVP